MVNSKRVVLYERRPASRFALVRCVAAGLNSLVDEARFVKVCVAPKVADK